MNTKLILFALSVGAASGAIGALCGVGGGVLLVPAFVFGMGLQQKTAVATSLSVIVLSSLAASCKNWAGGLIEWQIALPAAVGAVLAAWFTADLLKTLSNATLTRAFAVLLITVGVAMLFKSAEPPA